MSTSCIDLTAGHVYSGDIINQKEVNPNFYSCEHLDFCLDSCNVSSELGLSELEFSKESKNDLKDLFQNFL